MSERWTAFSKQQTTCCPLAHQVNIDETWRGRASIDYAAFWRGARPEVIESSRATDERAYIRACRWCTAEARSCKSRPICIVVLTCLALLTYNWIAIEAQPARRYCMANWIKLARPAKPAWRYNKSVTLWNLNDFSSRFLKILKDSSI